MRLNTRMLLFYVLTPPCMAGTLLAPVRLRAQQAPVKKEAQALYDRYGSAIKKKDIKAIGDLLAPDMADRDKSGKIVTRAAMLLTMQQGLNEITKIQSATFTVTKAAMQNNKLVVEATFHITGILADPQGKTHTMDETALARDTWTKSGGKWLVFRSVDLPGGKLMVDGKLVPDPAGR